MSLENAKAFHSTVAQDPALQERILTFINDNEEMPDWQALASDYGFEVTQQEAQDYMDQLVEDDYELSDFELEMVSAGVPTSCSSDGG